MLSSINTQHQKSQANKKAVRLRFHLNGIPLLYRTTEVEDDKSIESIKSELIRDFKRHLKRTCVHYYNRKQTVPIDVDKIELILIKLVKFNNASPDDIKTYKLEFGLNDIDSVISTDFMLCSHEVAKRQSK